MKSKKQVTISRSSSEAEYRSITTTIYEIILLLQLLSNIYVPHLDPISLYCDNQVTRYVANNPVYHERTKHIKVDIHFVRDCI